MDHYNYKEYTLSQLYEALDAIDEINYPGKLDAIEGRINELEGNNKNKLEGLSGWLVLIAIGIIITPVRIIMLMAAIYTEVFSSGIWQTLTTPGGEAYNPLWAPIIVGNLLINSVLVLVWLVAGYKFFTHHRDFPKWYIGIIVFTLIFIVLDAFSIKLALPNGPIFNPDTMKEFVRSLITVVIWVPYMLVSKRVKATFIK